ncbi:DNA polymerase I [Kordiimonas sediminis]|uniref:DNA polymerase I n=1 Tax=Kordiimonas sediminis TaxID=1735581 RepID=A0A919E577_9PROT|nr:DNA polymerase I [Kordiimonas sediminis]GHF14147.1 DNA polymerase I [Kordiimonas sediminis]
MPDPAKRPHLYLIDGSGYIFRAYHALPPISRGDGTPVGAVYGFSNMLFKLLQDLGDNDRPSHLAVIFDAGRTTFRNDIYPEYKAHRPPAPEDLIPQFPIIREAVEAFGVEAIEMQGYEADDLIATYATQARDKGWRVTIVSSDKDLMQLIDDNISMFDSMKSTRIGIDGVADKFGVGPDRVIDVQALAGDSADNVPGVPGIGVKTAAQLINEYGNLETLLDKAEEIKQPKRRQNLIDFAEQARVSKQLVTLAVDAPVETGLDAFAVRNPQAEKLLSFIDKQQFRSLRAKVLNHYGDTLEGSDPVTDVLVTPKEIEYQCVTTKDVLATWVEHIKKAGQVTIDTETTSLDPMLADLVGISLSIEPGKACYIPVGHVGESDDLLAEAPEQLSKDHVIQTLKPVLEDRSILKIAQNMKYDRTILARCGINVSPFDDTMLISYALDAGKHGHGMDELAGIHLDITPIPFKEIAGTGKNQITFDKVPLDKATTYAAEDADITGRLWRILKPRLAAEGATTVYETLERPLSSVLSAMEQEGVKVDTDTLRRLSNEFATGMASLETEIHELAGREFNIASPKQLGEILFDEMGLSGGKRSAKTGAYTTNAEVLEALAAEGHTLPAKVLEYRQFAKLKSTYTDALVAQVNPTTGRVHTSYHMAATTTGRLSSNDPNLQNIPIRTSAGRKIRQAFIPEAGNILLAADYSQIELRVLAHMADIDALKTAFSDGIDIHAMTASEVFGVPIDDMDPMVRRQAKAINFGIIYGISAFGLARQLGISRGDAQTYINAYFEKFPGIRAYMDTTIDFAKKHGYVETLFGRKCHIKALTEKNPMRRQFGERAAINAPIQGTAADILRRAMIRMPKALKEAGLEEVKMLLQVHDELVFELPETLRDKAETVIRETMEAACKPVLDLSVPLVVDCGFGANWDEAH